MNKKVVEIVQDGSYRAGQPSGVLLHEGDTIEFNNGDEGGTTLVLTDETRKILSPTPASTAVEIAAGASVSFQVKAVSQKQYCCQVLPEGTPPETIYCEMGGAAAALIVLSSHTRSADQRTGRGL